GRAPRATRGEVPADFPDPPDRTDEPQDTFVLSHRGEECDRGADVVVVELEAIEQVATARRQVRLRTFGKREKELGMACSNDVCLARLEQSLGRVLADGLEPRQPRLRLRRSEREEVFLCECGDASHDVAVVAADGVCRVDRPAAGEDGEARERRLLSSREEVVAPRQCVPQRLLALWMIARSRDES